MGCHALLQGIFPTQGSNPSLLHCRWILYRLSRQGSPRILEWVACPWLQGNFLTRELNWGLLKCRWILYQLSYLGSPLVTQSCLTLCDSMDCSLPGSSVRGILQARILEWVAIPFCRGSSQLRDQTQVSLLVDSLPSEPKPA